VKEIDTNYSHVQALNSPKFLSSAIYFQPTFGPAIIQGDTIRAQNHHQLESIKNHRTTDVVYNMKVQKQQTKWKNAQE
jgi:hypothetical protein